MTPQKITKVIRNYRKHSALSLQKLAQLAGIEKTAVIVIEMEKKPCNKKTLLEIPDI